MFRERELFTVFLHSNMSTGLQTLLQVFPPIRHAFAYGSSILCRTPDPTRQLDFIFLVDHSAAWHQANLAANPQHYSAKAQALGAEAIAKSASAAAGFHYNPYVALQGQICKYGVVETTRAIADIKDWDTFYLSARLHKPVLELISDSEVVQCQRLNLQRAIAVGLLTTPQTVSEEDLYLHISQLSYLGDPRLEDAGKLESMVADNISAFQQMYRPVLHLFPSAVNFEAGVVEVSSR